ncbi:DUF2851 family protein [Bacteroidales bacterium OttesenSCG-928-L03]|nr:DUF2851 family protein [Bacteroidales bacterium OttesenSCG-928-L03]
METLLHYVWKYRLYEPDSFMTTDGEELEIVDPGIYNTDAGPDFFNAKIRIGNRVWAGNVEIHRSSDDWYKHRHEVDEAYCSVILHVVETVTGQPVADAKGRSIPQWVMRVPEKIRRSYDYLLEREDPMPCRFFLSELNPIYLSSWKDALFSERLERKTTAIFELLETYNNDWNEVFYITLARSFGFGINSDAFERLAKSLPLRYLAKHADSVFQTEALFLGQAGQLEIAYPDDSYYCELQREYEFLRKKYDLQPMFGFLFKSLRIRPNNFPHIKIVQLAELIRNCSHLFASVLDVKRPEDYAPLFITNVSPYWLTHYQFGKESAKRPKSLGTSSIRILLINTVAPILFAYGKRNNEAIRERAIRLLEFLPVEENRIVSDFVEAGMPCRNAYDSQAVIQLRREYCEKKKCIYCRIGFKMMVRE